MFIQWIKQLMTEQNKRLYDLIFPFFMIWIFPPMMIIALVGNYIVDGLVIFIVLWLNKVSIRKAHWGYLTKMWAIGLLVDILGMVTLIVTVGAGPNSYTIWNAPLTALGFLVVVLGCGVLIGWANYVMSKKYISEQKVRWAIAISMGVITAPWTFLIPTQMVFS